MTISAKRIFRRIITFISLPLFCIHLLSCEKPVFSGNPEKIKTDNYKLTIESNPTKADVYLNGKNTGYTTPCSLTWLENEQDTFTLKLNLYNDTTFVMNNLSTSGSKCFIDFRANSKNYGKIGCITIPEKASISLDGKKTNFKTPYTISTLEPGNHTVAYSFPEHRDDSMKVEVTASTISYASITLEDTSQWVSYSPYNSKVLSEKVYSITTDGNNNVWMGSLEGLSKFDGKSWKTYTKSNSVLRSNVINALLADKQNRIWVGTPKGIYAIVNGTLMDYSFNLPDQSVIGIAESKEGIIWTAIGGGVCKLNNSVWQQFTISNSGLKDNYPMCISIDGNDKVWVGSRYYGLSILDGTTWSYLTTASMNISGIEPGIGSIHFAEDGTIWVSTVRTDFDMGRVVYFKNNLWSHYSRPELNNNHTKQIRTWKGNVLFATKSGLGILNNMNEFEFFRKGNTKLWDMNTYQTAIDRDGNIWFGTSICGAGKAKKILLKG